MATAAGAKYKPGDQVRILDDTPPHHHRTPWYIKGKIGRVNVLWGEFHNPESRAYGGSGLPKQPLYLVQFDQIEIWGEYRGPSKDKVYVDVFEDWLESV